MRVRGARPVRRGDELPSVSFVISAYNEADVIRRKLENTIALDYPRDLLEVVVISDASTDRTDAIAAEFTATHGVRVARQPERAGKTAGLNRTVPTLRGDIVVFSDANAVYERNALKMLVRNFADPQVGYVTGEARYVEGGKTAADAGERTYWDYEISIKKLETSLGSMVGGDGAIYAIRAFLWQTLPPAAINDFLNPLQIVSAGWRGVYEPEAICYEDTAGTPAREYRRRVRIVSRSWRAVFQAPGVLNPFRTGWFAFSLVSHKMLRWLTGGFAAAAAAGLVGMIFEAGNSWSLAAAGVAASGTIAFRPTRRVAALAGYFSIIQAASLVGVLKGTFGRVEGTWSTPRETAKSGKRAVGPEGFSSRSLAGCGGRHLPRARRWRTAVVSSGRFARCARAATSRFCVITRSVVPKGTATPTRTCASRPRASSGTSPISRRATRCFRSRKSWLACARTGRCRRTPSRSPSTTATPTISRPHAR